MTFDEAINKATCIYSLMYYPNASMAVVRNTVDEVEDNFVYFTTPDEHIKRKVTFLDFAEKLREDKRDIDAIVLPKIKERPDQDAIAVMYYLDNKNAIKAIHHFGDYAWWFSHNSDEDDIDDEEITGL